MDKDENKKTEKFIDINSLSEYDDYEEVNINSISNSNNTEKMNIDEESQNKKNNFYTPNCNPTPHNTNNTQSNNFNYFNNLNNLSHLNNIGDSYSNFPTIEEIQNLNKNIQEYTNNNISNSHFSNNEPNLNTGIDSQNNFHNKNLEGKERISNIPNQAVINVNNNDYYYDSNLIKSQTGEGGDETPFTNYNHLELETYKNLVTEIIFSLINEVMEIESNKQNILYGVNIKVFSVLKVIVSNIIKQPNEMKFRELKFENQKISLLLQVVGVKELLMVLGFDDILMIDGQKALLLLEYN